MFDYTKAAITKISDDFKKLSFVLGVSGQFFYIAYLAYSLITGKGILWANIVLSVVSVAYFIFYLVTNGKIDKSYRNAKKRVRRAHAIIKLTVRAFTLIAMLYSIYYTVLEISVLSITFTALSLISFIFQILLEIVRWVIENRYELFVTGWEADIEKIKQPFQTAKNILSLKFLQPNEEEEQPEKVSKARMFLDKKVSEARAKAKNKNENK